MFAVRLQYPKGRETVSKITAHGEVYTGYDAKTWKTKAGAQRACDRAEKDYPFVIYESDVYGREM